MAYTEEKINKTVKDLQNLLMEADNFSPYGSNQKKKQDKEYKQFWLGLRNYGPEILGLIKHLLEVLEKKGKTNA
ncbi:hypothetical protein CMI38_06115 [Candidatus Pacearchaeota archaeon]|jgi:hypothetical protein|nr:hypothetical protein [Candidatus Pacearchaeota archaeon]